MLEIANISTGGLRFVLQILLSVSRLEAAHIMVLYVCGRSVGL